MIRHAETKSGGDAEQFYSQAEDLLKKLEDIRPGEGAYNLACIAALRGQEKKCQGWLKISKKFGKLPDADHILKDKDLNTVREKEWFKKMLYTLA